MIEKLPLELYLILSISKRAAGPHSAVGKVSDYRCAFDWRSMDSELHVDPGLTNYFRGDWSWNNFYDPSPSFLWFIQEGLFSVTSESMSMNYWLTACSILPRKKCSKMNWLSPMNITVDWDITQNKTQTGVAVNLTIFKLDDLSI